jgi:hypothetical protein
MATLVIAIVLAAGLAVVWVRVVQTLTAPSNAPRAIGQPGALVWDGRVFTSPSQLKAYLGARSYARWAARHPTAFGAPAPVAVRHTASTKTKTKTKTTTTKASTPTIPKPKPVDHHVAVPSPVITPNTSRSLLGTALVILLALGGIALGASALLPRRLAPISVQRVYAQQDRRTAALAAATAMLLGLAVSFYLS